MKNYNQIVLNRDYFIEQTMPTMYVKTESKVEKYDKNSITNIGESDKYKKHKGFRRTVAKL